MQDTSQSPQNNIEDAVKKFISDVLLGVSSDVMGIDEPELTTKAKVGFFHAVMAALSLSRKHESDVLVSILDEGWNGIVIIVRHPKNYTRYGHRIKVCRIQLGMVEICDDPMISRFWPSGRIKIAMYLIH